MGALNITVSLNGSNFTVVPGCGTHVKLVKPHNLESISAIEISCVLATVAVLAVQLMVISHNSIQSFVGLSGEPFE